MPRSPGLGDRRRRPRSTEEERIGSVLDAVLGDPAFSRGLPIGRLAASWADVVGPRLSSETAPVSLDGGVLVVAASTGPWGAQARFLADEIRRQANAALGEQRVASVRVVVRPEPLKPL